MNPKAVEPQPQISFPSLSRILSANPKSASLLFSSFSHSPLDQVKLLLAAQCNDKRVNLRMMTALFQGQEQIQVKISILPNLYLRPRHSLYIASHSVILESRARAHVHEPTTLLRRQSNSSRVASPYPGPPSPALRHCTILVLV